MEPTPFELTLKQKVILPTLSRETGKPIPTVLEEALQAFQEHDRLSKTTRAARNSRKKKRFWEVAGDLLADVPQDAFDKLPVDGASQHDPSIYGTLKHSSS